MTKIILKKGREDSLLRFHPWVFSGAIAQIVGEPAEGDIVGVFSQGGDFLAYGHYQIGSIAVRVLSFAGEDVLSPDFWKNMIARALRVRVAVGLACPVSSAAEPVSPVAEPVSSAPSQFLRPPSQFLRPPSLSLRSLNQFLRSLSLSKRLALSENTPSPTATALSTAKATVSPA